jgi:Fe-S-cluster containining protein
MASPCATCVLGCCYRHTINISGYDLWLLANGLELQPTEFVQAVPVLFPSPRAFRLAESGVWYQLALQKRPTAAEHQPCIFLLELPGQLGRCGVYGLRPGVCRSYPAYLRNGLVGRRDDVLCPDDAWYNGELDAPQWRADLIQQFVEFDIYELAVARWNFAAESGILPTTATLDQFLDYLMQFYHQLAALRAQWSPDQSNLMINAWESCLDRLVSPLTTECVELEPWAEKLTAIRLISNSFFANPFPMWDEELAAWEAQTISASVDVKHRQPTV